MKRRRCSICGRYLSRYLIVSQDGLACPPCGPKVDGGAYQRAAQHQLERLARLILRRRAHVENAV